MPPQGRFNLPYLVTSIKNGCCNIGDKTELRRAATTLLVAQKLLWFHPQQKGTVNNINFHNNGHFLDGHTLHS